LDAIQREQIGAAHGNQTEGGFGCLARLSTNHDLLALLSTNLPCKAAAKPGELSKKIEKSPGGRPPNNCGGKPQSLKADALEKAGIGKREASDFERLSEVPRDEFEAALVGESIISDLLALGAKPVSKSSRLRRTA
jgi:hypothetical protein